MAETKTTAETPYGRGLLSEDGLTCTFTLGVPIAPGATVFFTKEQDLSTQPVVEALFDIPHVDSVLAKDDILIVAQSGGEWSKIIPQAEEAIAPYVGFQQPPVELIEETPTTSKPIERDPKLEAIIWDKVATVIEQEINPGIASHGGFIELLEVVNDTIYLMMGGGCQGCGMAALTLRQGVEAAIRYKVPEVGEVRDSTDHEAGLNPYF